MKKIGIILDGLVRHTSEYAKVEYEKWRESKSFEAEGYDEYDENGEIISTIDRTVVKDIVNYHHPANKDIQGISNILLFDSKQEYFEFLFRDAAYNIFSEHGKFETEELSSLKALIRDIYNQHEDVKIYICGLERSMAKQGTFMFLHKNNVNVDGVLFYMDYDELFNDNYDRIYTNEKYFETKNSDKIHSELKYNE